MKIRTVFVLVLSVLLVLLPVSPTFAAQMTPTQRPLEVCLSNDGVPTDRCFKAQELSLNLATPSGNVGGETRAGKANLVVDVDPQDFAMVATLAEVGLQGDNVQVCIVDGANICPMVPFKNIRICITTGQLTGTTCPPSVFEASLEETLTLRSIRQRDR